MKCPINATQLLKETHQYQAEIDVIGRPGEGTCGVITTLHAQYMVLVLVLVMWECVHSTYVHLYIHTFIQTYTHAIHTYITHILYIHTYIHTYCIYIHTHILHIHTYCIYIHTHILYIHTYCIYIHTYILYIRTCIHTLCGYIYTHVSTHTSLHTDLAMVVIAFTAGSRVISFFKRSRNIGRHVGSSSTNSGPK